MSYQLPLLHDFLSAGVKEKTAVRWHGAVYLLKQHAESMAEFLETQKDNPEALHLAFLFRQFMRENNTP